MDELLLSSGSSKADIFGFDNVEVSVNNFLDIHDFLFPHVVNVFNISYEDKITTGKNENNQYLQISKLANVKYIISDDRILQPSVRSMVASVADIFEIIHAITAGTLEKNIGIEQLKQAMPLMWDDQKKMFGME